MWIWRNKIKIIEENKTYVNSINKRFLDGVIKTTLKKIQKKNKKRYWHKKYIYDNINIVHEGDWVEKDNENKIEANKLEKRLERKY